MQYGRGPQSNQHADSKLDVQLLIASKHLEKSHSVTIRGYSSKQLEHFNHKALEDQLVGEFAVIVGD